MAAATGDRHPLQGTAIHGLDGSTYREVHVDPSGNLVTAPLSTGVQKVEGNVAGGAADSGNPVKVAGVYNSTLPTYTNGQRAELQLSSKGIAFAHLLDFSTFLTPTFFVLSADGVTAAALVAITCASVPHEMGSLTTLDRVRHSRNQTDTFTATGNGTSVNLSGTPFSKFSIQVKATGAVTSWDVRLEVSLDGTNFFEIGAHTNVTPADGGITFVVDRPARHVRSRTAALTLGGGTNIVVTVLASAR